MNQRWIIATTVLVLLFIAVFFRYDITAINANSSGHAYVIDRWTGEIWLVEGRNKFLVKEYQPVLRFDFTEPKN